MKPLAEFVLPFPPSVNTYWRRNGHQYFIDKPGRAFRANVLASVVETFGRIPKPMTGAVAMEIELHPPDKRARDVDNYAKGVGDGLAHAGVYANDSQIKRLVVEMFPSVGKPGRAVVRLFEYQRS